VNSMYDCFVGYRREGFGQRAAAELTAALYGYRTHGEISDIAAKMAAIEQRDRPAEDAPCGASHSNRTEITA
jgi:hypothetical protein